MAGLGCQKRGVRIARVMKSEGGSAAKDMSSMHEEAESPKEEAKETKLEKEGYKETKAGKMIKAAKKGVEKVSKKMQDHYKENVKFVTPSPKLGKVKETPEPSDEMDEYFTKETRVGKNQFKVERVKKAKGGRPGLWANINARKKAGTSRSKSESTISPKAYANMKAGFPKKKK